MVQIKEITVFSIGDSLELKSWSNVPYFFTKSLEDKNIRINRINVEENRFLSFIYKYSVFILLKVFYRNSDHTYFRTGLNYSLTNLKIRKALKKYSDSDINLFLTYSFSAKRYSNKKTILFGDWSYLYKIDAFFKRKPYWFEKAALDREKRNITTADIVISLFPKSSEFNIQNYNNTNQNYFGNVINANFPLDKNKLIGLKLKSQKILFIGSKKYLKGALALINAFEKISEKGNTKAELHIIGIEAYETAITLPGLFYYGYLNKGINGQNEEYYRLISEAKMIVNTTTNWGAFSAMTEAMYYYTPVITSPYSEFTKTYGIDIDFGYYVSDNSTEELITKIKMILDSSDSRLIELMNNAHNKVKDFSWSSYTDKFLDLITKNSGN